MGSLRLKRRPDETWKECAVRCAKSYGLDRIVGEFYDIFIEHGMSEERAAFSACYEWDVCEYVEDTGESDDKEETVPNREL